VEDLQKRIVYTEKKKRFYDAIQDQEVIRKDIFMLNDYSEINHFKEDCKFYVTGRAYKQ